MLALEQLSLSCSQVFLAKKTEVEVAAAEGYVYFVERTRHWQNVSTSRGESSQEALRLITD